MMSLRSRHLSGEAISWSNLRKSDKMILSMKLKSRHKFEISLEIGKHLMTLGNLAIGALVFGQAFSNTPFDFKVAILGLLLLAFLYSLALTVMRGGVRA